MRSPDIADTIGEFGRVGVGGGGQLGSAAASDGENREWVGYGLLRGGRAQLGRERDENAWLTRGMMAAGVCPGRLPGESPGSC
ncbi:hypothetical protein GCM10027167_81860 [Nocardia heshunensis]